MWQGLIDDFTQCFVANGRGGYLLRGLGVTMEVALSAIAVGLLVGFLVAVIRSSHDRYGYFRILNFVAKVYLNPIVLRNVIEFRTLINAMTNILHSFHLPSLKPNTVIKSASNKLHFCRSTCVPLRTAVYTFRK